MEASDSNPQNGREWRRLRAIRLKQRGWHQRDIASALGVREETVSRWLARARHGGHEALRARSSPGRPPKLTSAQRRMIPEFLWHGAEAYGFRGEAWTCARVAEVIFEEFGVRYHKDHVGRLLKELEWTPQTPLTRAIQRDEEAIRRWRGEAWPRLQRQARHEGRVLIFEDESGFYLLPGVIKTYAPKGQTPIIRPKVTRDHLSVMGGMTPAGKVYLHLGTARVAQRVAHDRVPRALAADGGRTAVGHLGRLADPPQGGGQGVRVRHRRPNLSGGAAALCPRSQPVG
jgi:transposase